MKKRDCLKIILLAAVLAAGYVYSQWTSYHDFEGRCLECHLTAPEPGKPPGAFVKDISSMCYGCHSDEENLSHPVDITPSMKVPDSFPLDWSGKVTCATCHPIHRQGSGPFRLRSRAGGQGFCMLCHNDLESALHTTSVGSAHVSAATGSKFVAGELGAVLDEMSIKCLACHDATFAGDSLVETPKLFHNNAAIGVSHPIGMSYYETKRKYYGAYRNVRDLPPQIKLFGGVVGCVSCHNPYSKLHSELVMSNEGSALCLACHVK
ncbi:MAG: cytochrome c3 family protein [Deltaproteobacteria bacterium]|nr:cytochrome c3 family protein [Deltaproteobacteria bacterium]